MLDMTQILLLEVCLRRKAVLCYPEDFAQVVLVGFFSLRNFVVPCIRWETECDCLHHSPLVLRSLLFVFIATQKSVWSNLIDHVT